MPPILHHLKATPIRLGQKRIAPHQPLHIFDLPLHDATALRLRRSQKLRKPYLRRKMIR